MWAAGPCRAEWLYRAAGPTFSAEKNGATRHSAEKSGDTRCKLARFSLGNDVLEHILAHLKRAGRTKSLKVIPDSSLNMFVLVGT